MSVAEIVQAKGWVEHSQGNSAGASAFWEAACLIAQAEQAAS